MSPDSKYQKSNHVNLTIIGRPTPIYMIGDSHCLIYRDLLFSEDSIFKKTFITKAKYCRGLAAQNFSFKDDSLNNQLIQAMISESLFDENLSAFHLSTSQMTESIALAANQALNEPIVIIFCGDIDLRSVFLKQLGAHSDFILPFKVNLEHFSPIQEPQMIPLNLIIELANKMIQPLFKGLKLLKQSGFEKLYIHCLPAQTLDDKAYEKINGYFSPALLRYKSTLLFNFLFEKFCRKFDINFINIWKEVTVNNQLNPIYHLDHIHLNKQAAFLSLEKLITHQASSFRVPLIARYLQAWKQAMHTFKGIEFTKNLKLFKEFESNKIVILPDKIENKWIQELLAQLEFNLDVGNQHLRMDWTGNDTEAYSPHVLTAQPSKDTLKMIFELMYSPIISHSIQSCYPFAYVIPACRPFLSKPHKEDGRGPQAFHTDKGPPGFIRAIIYLSDVDEKSGPFEYKDKEGHSQYILGSAGTVFFFDANTIEHRGSPPISKERKVLDFVLLPKIEGVPDYILWPGMNHWPVDPYQFSIDGFVTYPEFKNTLLSVHNCS